MMLTNANTAGRRMDTDRPLTEDKQVQEWLTDNIFTVTQWWLAMLALELIRWLISWMPGANETNFGGTTCLQTSVCRASVCSRVLRLGDGTCMTGPITHPALMLLVHLKSPSLPDGFYWKYIQLQIQAIAKAKYSFSNLINQYLMFFSGFRSDFQFNIVQDLFRT